MARLPLQARVVVDESWQMAASLLEAATRLKPEEPRFAQLLVEARHRNGDIAGAIDALAHYRRLVPGDQLAQVQQIDLYLAQMETADAKVDYLQSLIAAEDAIAAEVRSHAAARAAQTMLERSRPGLAETMLDKALELNPLNADALRLQLATTQDQTRQQRVKTYLALLRATPTEPQVAASLARELANAGLYRPALEWFALALQMHMAAGSAAGTELAIDNVAALHLGGAHTDAHGLLGQVLQVDPTNTDAWLLRLALAEDSGDAAAQQSARREAANALSNRLALLQQAAGDKAATTRPINAPGEVTFPEPAPILQQLQAAGNPELLEAFGETAAAIAWLKIYFEKKPVDAVPWVGVLRTMYGEENPLVTRLEGWSFLAAGRPDEARVKLSAVAERDPLAAVGMILLNDPAAENGANGAAAAEARRLLGQHRSGLLGVLLTEALRERNVQPDPAPDAKELAALIEKSPTDFMDLLRQPQQFYSVRLDPVQVSHSFGEPILVRVTIHNTGKSPITLGNDGAIKRNLWFDVQLRGIVQNAFPGAAQDWLAGPLVLRPGESASQVARLDQGQLNGFLESNPGPTVQLSSAVTTNPTMVSSGVGPGPAGIRAPLTRLIQRTGSPLTADRRDRMQQTLSDGTPAEKVRTLEMMATYAQLLTQGEQNEGGMALAARFRDLVRGAMKDSEPSVRAWAGYLSAVIAAQQERPQLVEKLASGDWMQQVFALLLVYQGAAPKDVAERLAETEDPLVRSYASAMLELLAISTTQPAATQRSATTAPATAPAAPLDARPAP